MSWNEIWGKEEDIFERKYRDIQKYKDLTTMLKYSQGRVLEAGCGTGHIVSYLNKKGVKCYGLDNSEKALAIAKTKIKGRVIKGELTNIPFKNNYFDTVLCLGVIEHLTNQELEKSLNEIKRVLKRGGAFYVTVPNLFSWWEIVKLKHKLFGEWDRLYGYKEKAYTSFELKSLLKRFNFEIIEFIPRSQCANFMMGFVARNKKLKN